MAGQMALLLHERPSRILGFRGSELQSFLLDAMLLSRAIERMAGAFGRGPEGAARSTKELVRRKRARWAPPRRFQLWA